MNTSRREPEFELDQTDESIIIQAMENAYVDLSGGGGGEQEESQVIPLAHEEESTQDLEREREQRIGQQTGEGDVQQRTMNGWGANQEIDVRLHFKKRCSRRFCRFADGTLLLFANCD